MYTVIPIRQLIDNIRLADEVEEELEVDEMFDSATLSYKNVSIGVLHDTKIPRYEFRLPNKNSVIRDGMLVVDESQSTDPACPALPNNPKFPWEFDDYDKQYFEEHILPFM